MPWEPPTDAVAWTPPGDAIAADELGHDEIIAIANPKKVKAYTAIAERFSGTPATTIGEHSAAHAIPRSDWELFRAMLAKQYAADRTMTKVGYGTRLATSAVQGFTDVGVPLAKMVGALPKLDAEQERFKQELIGLRESSDPTILPETNFLGRAVQQTGRMSFPAVHAVTGGKAVGAVGRALGLGAKATGIATATGVAGASLPQIADQTYSSQIAEGADPNTARTITAISAPIEAAIESILPDPFSGYGAAFRGSVRQVAGKLLKQYTANYTKELAEEGLQRIVSETALEVGRQMDDRIPDQGFGQTLASGLSEIRDTALPLALMVAPGAAVGGVQVARESAARPARLAQLKEIRAKGYVSAEDGQAAGIPGETRRERLASADAEIQQLEQEIQNASAVSGPETEVRQPEGGEGIRGEGQVEVPAEPAGEVAAAPEILTSQELLNWLAQAEAAAPEAEQSVQPPVETDEEVPATAAEPIQQPAAETAPQRDIVIEIRSALEEGPVTVATPKVPSGFKIAKVRDDGKVVTKRGRVLTPDATWAIQPQEQTSAQPEPVREAVPPELTQAGITIKSTPKGWSVTGIPKEIADGLQIDYQGKRAGKGYFFRQDPTPGLLDAAREIAKQAELDASERAQGRRRTSIGYLEEETAGAFEQERAERLKLAKEELQRRNDAVDELVSQFVGKGQRGKFKLKLLNAAERGDADSLKRFDEMVEYAKDHPELGLPTDEHKLFALLASESFTKDDAAMEAEIDEELAAEIAAELGDESFDFGANAPEVKQTAIPGTEEAVASQERREEIGQANKQFKTPKEKQKAFISGLGKDLPGQETMFDVDGLDGGDAQPKPTKLQQAADAATKEAFDELDAFGKTLKGKGLASNPMLDPEVIAGAGRVVAKFAKAGTLKFASLIERLAKSIGQAAVDRIRPALEAEWDRLQRSGEVAGMEPRTPEATAEAPPPSSDDLTSIKKAIVNELREMVGLPEMEGSTPQTVEEWAEAARVTLAADPKAAIRLVNELATSPRPISQHDAMLLQFRYRQLANELQPVVDEYFEAVNSKDPVAIATARTALINARKAMTDFEETIHPSKETWGRTGVALQQMLRKDFSLEAILRRGQEANNGEELSPDQTAELTKLSKQLEDLQKQFDEQRRKTEALEAELASKRHHEETVKQVRQTKILRKSDKRKAAEKKLADAWENFRKAALTQAGAGPHLLGPAVEVAKAYVELGYVRFAEFMAAVRQNIPDADEKLFRQAWDQTSEAPEVDLTDRASLTKEARRIQRTLVELGMTDREQVIDTVHQALKEELPDLTRRQAMDALSRYGQFQTQSQDEIEKLIRGMNAEILKLSQIDQIEKAMQRVDELRAQGKTDEEIGKALADEKLLVEATGLVRDRPSHTIRQLTQKYNELKKAIPATPAGKAGLLQTALAQIERSLTNRIQDLRWEIEHGERIVRENRERPTSERITALEAERDALLNIHREMFPPKKKTMTEAQRIASAIRAADRAIEQMEKQLETRDFDQERRATLSSPELNARRARLQQLRAAREAAKALELDRMEGEGGRPTGRVPLSDAEIARRVYEASLRRRIADYQQTLAEGDFSPKPKKGPRELSASELKLKREMEDIRHQVLQKYADYHLAHLKGIAWTADKIMEAAHLSRALMTSFDLSAVMRQGGLAAMGHPVLAKRALVETVVSIASTYNSANAKALQGGVTLENVSKFLSTIDSRQAEFSFMHKLTQGAEGEFRLKAGLNLPSTDQAITRQEEAFQGRWGKLVPGVAVSSRLYTMILNKLRADLFDSMVQNLGRGGKVTMDEAKVIASFVNVATGRADLKMFNRAAATLNMVFFAPRYVASRFQYLAMPFYLPFTKGSWRVKRAIYQEYGRTAAGIGTALGLFALLGQLLYDDDDDDRPQIETDARSSDFLKVRIGETRLDFMAGLSQVIVLSSRLTVGQSKSSVTGKIRNFGEGYKPETRMSALARFGRTKFAPVPGAIATVADDWTNIVGQKETTWSLAGSMVSPLSMKDVVTTMRAQGLPKGTAMSLLSILGVGMSTYGPRTEYMTGDEEERQAQIAKDLKAMAWDSPEPAYSEFLTAGQLEQFEQRRQEKRGLVVYNATYGGKDEQEMVTRDKNREHLKEMGVSFEEARELLKDYYRRPDEKGRRGGITEGYFPRLRALKRIYE